MFNAMVIIGSIFSGSVDASSSVAKYLPLERVVRRSVGMFEVEIVAGEKANSGQVTYRADVSKTYFGESLSHMCLSSSSGLKIGRKYVVFPIIFNDYVTTENNNDCGRSFSIGINSPRAFEVASYDGKLLISGPWIMMPKFKTINVVRFNMKCSKISLCPEGEYDYPVEVTFDLSELLDYVALVRKRDGEKQEK